MTPNEIKEEVGALALEPVTEVDEDAFWAGLNRAIAQVNRIRPLTADITIHNRCLPVLHQTKDQNFSSGKSVKLEAKGCACFYLQVYGQGEITIRRNGAQVTEIDLIDNRRSNEYRFVISDYLAEDVADIEVEIGGKYAGTVISAVFYSEKFSDREEDVPSGQIYNVYPLREICSDIGHITQILYEDETGERRVEAKDFMIPDGKTLWLLKSKEGRYTIMYSKKLGRVSEDKEDDEIELDADLHALLPLLTGYYVWLEDKPEIAENLFAQYKQMEADIRVEGHISRHPAVQDVYGW